MGNNLYEASNNWAARPADERFWTLEDAMAMAKDRRVRSRQATIADIRKLSVGVDTESQHGASLALIGDTGVKAKLSHFAFDGLCNRVAAPSGFMRELQPETVAKVLNERIRACESVDAKLLLRANALAEGGAVLGGYTALGLTSVKYDRVWDTETLDRCLALQGQGWKVPPARVPCGYDGETRVATQADVIETGYGSLAIQVGDQIAPSGIYMSDRDMFVFMIDDQRRIQTGSNGKSLARGFFIENSEVYGTALKITFFLYDAVCGNHIVWGVENVTTVRSVHRGSTLERFDAQALKEISAFSHASALECEAKIATLQSTVIADTRQGVIDALFGKKLLSRDTLENCYDAAIADQQRLHPENNVNSVWGMAQGISAYSQTKPYAGDRTALDKAAGKLIEIAF